MGSTPAPPTADFTAFPWCRMRSGMRSLHWHVGCQLATIWTWRHTGAPVMCLVFVPCFASLMGFRLMGVWPITVTGHIGGFAGLNRTMSERIELDRAVPGRIAPHPSSASYSRNKWPFRDYLALSPGGGARKSLNTHCDTNEAVGRNAESTHHNAASHCSVGRSAQQHPNHVASQCSVGRSAKTGSKHVASH